MVDTRTLTEAIRVRVTPEQREELEAIAAREERSVGAIIRRALRDLLERERKETPA